MVLTSLALEDDDDCGCGGVGGLDHGVDEPSFVEVGLDGFHDFLDAGGTDDSLFDHGGVFSLSISSCHVSKRDLPQLKGHPSRLQVV